MNPDSIPCKEHMPGAIAFKEEMLEISWSEDKKEYFVSKGAVKLGYFGEFSLEKMDFSFNDGDLETLFEKENYENKSKRKEMKELIAYLKKLNPNADYNIFKTTFDINLNTVLGYHKGEDEYSFLDDYDTKK